MAKTKQAEEERALSAQDYADILVSALELLRENGYRVGVRSVPQKGERPPGIMLYVSDLAVAESGEIVGNLL